MRWGGDTAVLTTGRHHVLCLFRCRFLHVTSTRVSCCRAADVLATAGEEVDWRARALAFMRFVFRYSETKSLCKCNYFK